MSSTLFITGATSGFGEACARRFAEGSPAVARSVCKPWPVSFRRRPGCCR